MASTDGWPAPAKLNLFLHILGRREDGYHRLQTVFQFLDCCDTIHIIPRTGGVLRLSPAVPGVAAEGNLVIRAARALQQATGCRLGADVVLEKRIPVGGGLGGGSSDAATTLLALDHLWGLHLGEDRLAEIGLALGADVPVFVRGRAAWAEGVGEELTPVELPEPWYVVLVPACEISTADVFSTPELTRDTAPTTIPAFSFGDGRNDCEAVVRARYPQVDRAIVRLQRHAPARLTGTGGCVFASFADVAPARRALAGCRNDGWRGFLARGLNRSPVLGRLPAT